MWQLFVGWPGNPTDEELKRQYSPAVPAVLLWIPCFWLLYSLRAHGWAVVGIGFVSAVFGALLVKYRYKSSAIAAFAGWSLAIPVAVPPAMAKQQEVLFSSSARRSDHSSSQTRRAAGGF
jgi:hypothetical protein